MATTTPTSAKMRLNTLFTKMNLASSSHKNDFAAACDIAGMKISTSQTEVLQLSRSIDLHFLQVGRISLKQMEKFKYPGVAFMRGERQDEELDVRSDKVNAVMRALHHSVVIKAWFTRKSTAS